MNLFSHNQRIRAPRRGITLVETTIYIALFLVILNFALGIFMGIVRQSTDLRRASAQVAKTLQAGEQWRKDIRNSSTPIKPATQEQPSSNHTGRELCVMRTESNEIHYTVEDNTLWREVTGSAREPALRGVKHATLVREDRDHAHGWRLEIELLRKTKNATPITPLFSFIAAEAPQP